MNLACIAFTEDGLKIADCIRESQQFQVEVFNKHCYKEQMDNIFKNFEGVVFISSTGIAVRLCAPYLIHKAVDPAVVVIDDMARYCISLVSGHLGGANQLAQSLAELLHCQPIITTASDGRNIEAVDMFAKANDFYIESLEDAKKITAMMIEGRKIKLDTEVQVKLNYGNLSDDRYEGVISVSTWQKLESSKPCSVLRPRILNVGIGCRRGKSKQEILAAIEAVFQMNNLSMKSIKSIATVDVKMDEQGIIEASQALDCPMIIFSREEIAEVEDKFQASDFVRSNIGVSSVCEPCATLAGGKLIVSKTALKGITVAVAKEI